MVLETASRVSDEVKAEALDDAEPTTSTAEAPEAQKPVDATDAIPPELLRLIRRVLPAAWLVAVIAAGAVSGVELAFLVLAGGVLMLVITLMWSSVQSLTGASSLGFEEALGMGAPSKVEEEKRAVLRALKDLEYERGVGKITPEDYAELVAKYRADAKRLMQSVDEALRPARDRVEEQLVERLDRAGLQSGISTDPKLEAEGPGAGATDDERPEIGSKPAAPGPESTAKINVEAGPRQPATPEEKP
jgi:hypothetical protein